MRTIEFDDRVETRNDEGELHSFDDKHSRAYSNGDKHWYKEGKYHRLNGPAEEQQQWNFMIKLKREVDTRNDEGELHSFDNKPARTYNNGDKYWYKEGKLHRMDGPACEYDNCKIWCYKGKRIECNSTEEFLKIINLKAFW